MFFSSHVKSDCLNVVFKPLAKAVCQQSWLIGRVVYDNKLISLWFLNITLLIIPYSLYRKWKPIINDY